MKTPCFIFLLLVQQLVCKAQSHPGAEYYDSLAMQGKKHVLSGNYDQATSEYRAAFASIGGGFPEDRYMVARAWARLGVSDSAFYNLNRDLTKTDYLDYHTLVNEKDFASLNNFEEWNKILVALNPHYETYNDSLAHVLELIYRDDQSCRLTIYSVQNKYGSKSDEFMALWYKIHFYDSVDQEKVLQILDHYGWLSANVVGKNGSTALWLVIQHAPLEVQEKYYPIMKSAVDSGKASKKNLAYLQDRILMFQGKKQLYGTQYKYSPDINETVLYDVEDPQNLNKRRAEVGLAPMNLDKVIPKTEK